MIKIVATVLGVDHQDDLFNTQATLLKLCKWCINNIHWLHPHKLPKGMADKSHWASNAQFESALALHTKMALSALKNILCHSLNSTVIDFCCKTLTSCMAWCLASG